MRAELVESEPDGPRKDDGARETCNMKLDWRIPPKGTGVDGVRIRFHNRFICVGVDISIYALLTRGRS